MAKFAVVCFPPSAECSVETYEVIPCSWLNSSSTGCFWPPKHLERRFHKLVKDSVLPGEDWYLTPVSVWRKTGVYNFFSYN